MNTKLFLTLSTLFAASLALPFGSHANEATNNMPASMTTSDRASLVVAVDGLSSTTGQILVGLYDSENGFESERELMGRTTPVSGQTTEIVFDDLPRGDYALKIFHDEDSDGELDTNALGIPSEPYGFSNNASDPFSAPEWDETRFTLSGERTVHRVDLG